MTGQRDTTEEERIKLAYCFLSRNLTILYFNWILWIIESCFLQGLQVHSPTDIMSDNDQVHPSEPAETDGHWNKLGRIYPFKRGLPLQLQPIIHIWKHGSKVTISSDFSSESFFFWCIYLLLDKNLWSIIHDSFFFFLFSTGLFYLA